MFKKILIANRGEIAVRIIRACRELGIKTVAVYSDIEKNALHMQLADEAYCIGPALSKDSYLNKEKILTAAIISNSEAIHPGFGFLSEDSKFAEMCMKCHIIFIGPPASIINLMGNKFEARMMMKKSGISVIPGSDKPIYEGIEGLRIAEKIGYPVVIKPSMGGGGKGIRVSETSEDFLEQFHLAQRESVCNCGDDMMYIEKYIINAKHIEFQILADQYGNVIQLGERDCSVQRHHQKLIEETPCIYLTPELREKMSKAAVYAAKISKYENIGTVEFLLDQEKNFYFIEMNTRIQVEHPITEMVTGVDLIKEQLYIAAGLRTTLEQNNIMLNGHAIECRINAENPQNNFSPCTGTIFGIHLPGGNGVRIDTAIYQGCTITPFYDSMIAKVIVHEKTRAAAIDKMRCTLGEIILEGINTNIDFQYNILNHDIYQNGNFTTNFISQYQKTLIR
nr:acetyl-CoA carboxylase biotin carboxylase subunit [uncultured Clostridium sp.]